MAETIEKGAPDSPLIAAIAALFGNVVAILVFLIRKDDRFARFYALQAFIFDVAAGIAIGVAYVGVFFASFLLQLLGFGAAAAGGKAAAAGGMTLAFILPFGCFGLVLLGYLLIRLLMAYKAFSGEVFRLPIIGGFVEKYA